MAIQRVPISIICVFNDPGVRRRCLDRSIDEHRDEATVEYYLSEMLRIRATFSDAQSLTTRSAFRRVERAGIDLVVFFSF